MTPFAGLAAIGAAVALGQRFTQLQGGNWCVFRFAPGTMKASRSGPRAASPIRCFQTLKAAGDFSGGRVPKTAQPLVCAVRNPFRVTGTAATARGRDPAEARIGKEDVWIGRFSRCESLN